MANEDLITNEHLPLLALPEQFGWPIELVWRAESELVLK